MTCRPAVDALNRLTNMVDAAGTTKYTYYTGGLLNTEDGPWASDTVTYTYNNRMRASLSVQQPTGAWTNGYTWDAAHRLGTETSPAGTFTYTYQSPGRLVKKLALPNTSYITNTYDNAARLTGTYLDNSANTVLDKAEYLYNFGNQRTRLTRTDGSYYTNSYDNIGQLKWADSTVNTEDRGYLYDAAWNLNKLTNNGAVTTFTVDSKNQLTSGLQLNYSYDANGNLYDADGASAYEYDDENQLVAAEMVDDYRIEFLYDGRGRMRVRRDYSWNVGWTQIGETRYVYVRWNASNPGTELKQHAAGDLYARPGSEWQFGRRGRHWRIASAFARLFLRQLDNPQLLPCGRQREYHGDGGQQSVDQRELSV